MPIDSWQANGQAQWVSEEVGANVGANVGEQAELAPGQRFLRADIPGSVWKVIAQPGDTLAAGDPVAILESMKMEITLSATQAGTLIEWLVIEGTPVAAGQAIAILQDQADE